MWKPGGYRSRIRTALVLLALLVLSSGDSRDSQEGVVGVSVPDQQLLVWRDGLCGGVGRGDTEVKHSAASPLNHEGALAVRISASRGRHTPELTCKLPNGLRNSPLFTYFGF